MDNQRVVSAALFVVLGIVAAFTVSALAGVWDEEPAGTGFRALGPGADQPDQVRVEVLNGAGVGGLARDATYRLRGSGFDVVFFGNADHFGHRRSVVIDRVGSPGRARAVADALGIDSVTTAIDSSLMLEATVVLGGDWPPKAPPDQGWMDRLRGLMEDADSTGSAADTGSGPADAGSGAPEGGR